MEKISVKTVIIGAGISGISTSIKLLKNDYDQFVVFEALERTGGRVYTEINDNGYYEIGAQWIHGQIGNPLYEIARQNNLVREDFREIIYEDHRLKDKNINSNSTVLNNNILKEFDVKSNDEKILFVTQYGKKISLDFAKSVYDTITRIIYSAEEVGLKYANTNNENRVGDYLYDKYTEIVQKELGVNLLDSNSEGADLRKILNGLFVMRAKREHIRSGCSNLFNLSLRNFASCQIPSGHSYVELNRGYTPIVDAIIEKNKSAFESRVKLRHFVKKIILSSNVTGQENIYDKQDVHSRYTGDRSKVVLIVCDATDQKNPKDFVVVCDHVLCTMSLGFLKENVNTLFEPLNVVSDQKRQAIQNIGFGTINKIFLFYDSPFWNKSLELINVIWLPENDEFRLEKVSYANTSRKVWYEDISKFEVVNSYPNALSAWVAGSEDFEKLDDSTIASECTNLLRKFMKNDDIPLPKSILRSKWNSNVFSRGSYTHMPLGSRPDDFDTLAQPLPSEKNPLILFAGEHTSRGSFSTVHGAYLTGLREADRILKLQKSSK